MDVMSKRHSLTAAVAYFCFYREVQFFIKRLDECGYMPSLTRHFKNYERIIPHIVAS